MPKKDTNKTVNCSFCGKPQDSVRKIVAGPGVYICDECVSLCNNIIGNEFFEEPKAIKIKDIDTNNLLLCAGCEIKKINLTKLQQ